MKVYFLFFLMTAFISACTFRSMIFKNLDWIIERRINSMFDLNNNQEAQVEQSTKDLMSYLKGPLGQEIISSIDSLLTNSQDGLTREEIKAAINHVLTMRAKLMKRYALPTAVLFKSLSDQQLQHFDEQQAESDDDLVEVLESKNFNEAAKESAESWFDILSAWYGDLSPQQKEFVYSNSSLAKEDFQKRLEYRQKSRDFLTNLIKNKSESEIEEFFKQWADQPGLRAQQLGYDSFTKWEDRLVPFLEQFHASLTPQQWQTFRSELRSLRQDIAYFIKS